jgi:hypothetical protein
MFYDGIEKFFAGYDAMALHRPGEIDGPRQVQDFELRDIGEEDRLGWQ